MDSLAEFRSVGLTVSIRIENFATIRLAFPQPKLEISAKMTSDWVKLFRIQLLEEMNLLSKLN